MMRVDSSDLLCRSSSFIHHIARRNLSPGVSEKTVTSPPGSENGAIPSTKQRDKPGQLQRAKNYAFQYHTQFSVLLFLSVVPRKPIFRMCYLDLCSVGNAAITSKSSLQKKS